MLKTEHKREQIENEIKHIYDVFLRKKVWEDGEFHCDFVDVYFLTDCIAFNFKGISYTFHLSYDGKIAITDYHEVYPFTYPMPELRKFLKLLRKLVLYMV
jgi:hypothetical protein